MYVTISVSTKCTLASTSHGDTLYFTWVHAELYIVNVIQGDSHHHHDYISHLPLSGRNGFNFSTAANSPEKYSQLVRCVQEG